jgi:2-keto-3-deoxy-L-rhamnonate aldolase RhmA
MRHWFLSGEPKIGTVLTIDNPAVTELVRIAGFDWAWIDGEHGAHTETSAAIASAILGSGVKSFVRVPDKSPTTLKRFLDAGCDGIIVPHVSSRAAFDAIARAALFPPKGERSVDIARAQGYGSYFAQSIAARNYALIVQIETAEGVANVRDIVSAPDLDAILIGPYDLSGSLGVLGDVGSEQVTAAIATVLAACKVAKVPCGIFAANGEAARQYLAQGFDFVGAGVDTMLLLSAMKGLLGAARAAP